MHRSENITVILGTINWSLSIYDKTICVEIVLRISVRCPVKNDCSIQWIYHMFQKLFQNKIRYKTEIF